MFLAEETTVAVGFADATRRLTHVINHGAIHAASAAAYEHGQTVVLRVGPAGDRPGLSKLVRAQFLPPVQRGGMLNLTLRWEATGPGGELFPALDADLLLAPPPGGGDPGPARPDRLLPTATELGRRHPGPDAPAAHRDRDRSAPAP
jgi:hypothetical protein